MPLRTRDENASMVPIDGGNVTREMYLVQNIGAGTPTVAATVTGVGLRRTIQDDVKVRPTNVTATLVLTVGGTYDATSRTFTTAPSSTHEIIMLHNGPSGGFAQNDLRILDAGHAGIRVFVNEVVDTLFTVEG